MEMSAALLLCLAFAEAVAGAALWAHAAGPRSMRRWVAAAFLVSGLAHALRAPLAGWGAAPTALAAGAATGLATATFLVAALHGPSRGKVHTGAAIGLCATLGVGGLGLAAWAPPVAWQDPTLAVGAGLAACALSMTAPWLRWAALGTTGFALAVGVAGLASGPQALGAVALAAGLVAFVTLVTVHVRRTRQRMTSSLALAIPLLALLALLPWTRAIVLASFAAGAPLLVLAGGARRLLVPVLVRALAGAATSLAAWALLARAAAFPPDIVAALALLGGAATVILLDATATPRILLPRRRGGRASVAAAGDYVLGRYRLSRALGEGSFGTTWRATDGVTGQDVAVKVLRADRLVAAAVRAEADVLGRLRHPNIVTLLDAASEEDETCLVMELVEGGSLAEQNARGPLAAEAFARIASGLLDALRVVHAAGILHRDVKPSNVLLTPTGEAKLADFGIAHVQGAEATLGGNAQGAAVGSIRFMSPEQARGRILRPSSDLYSAAVTLFEAWTGEPYARMSPNESAVELQMRIADAPPFDRAVPGPPALRGWFARALAPEPAARFGNAEEMRNALHAALGASLNPEGRAAVTDPR